jgi:hypothetical protein
LHERGEFLDLFDVGVFLITSKGNPFDVVFLVFSLFDALFDLVL